MDISITLLDLANLIAKLRRPLEILRIHRSYETTAQAVDLAAPILLVGAPGDRVFPRVLRAAVQPAEQTAQMGFEVVVAFRAPESPRLLELRRTHPAGRAFPEDACLIAHALPDLGQEVGQRRRVGGGRRLHALFRGAGLTEMQNLHLVVLHLGELNDRVILPTMIAPLCVLQRTLPYVASR
jgi:hypothetical protein